MIKDNNDPEQMGRVKVNYYWYGQNHISDWMRVMQAYAGSGKGFYFRPEIGEEVQVSFEGANVERPYVSGTFHNGREMPEFFDEKNSVKGWKLRFGQMFKFIEKIGIWLSDPSGNEIHLDEEGKNINATTPETFTIRAKNIVFEASESIIYSAGTNITESAIGNKTTGIGGVMSTSVGMDKILNVTGNYDHFVDGDFNSHAEKGMGIHGKGIDVNSHDETIDVKASKNINKDSGEQSNAF